MANICSIIGKIKLVNKDDVSKENFKFLYKILSDIAASGEFNKILYLPCGLDAVTELKEDYTFSLYGWCKWSMVSSGTYVELYTAETDPEIIKTLITVDKIKSLIEFSKISVDGLRMVILRRNSAWIDFNDIARMFKCDIELIGEEPGMGFVEEVHLNSDGLIEFSEVTEYELEEDVEKNVFTPFFEDAFGYEESSIKRFGISYDDQHLLRTDFQLLDATNPDIQKICSKLRLKLNKPRYWIDLYLYYQNIDLPNTVNDIFDIASLYIKLLKENAENVHPNLFIRLLRLGNEYEEEEILLNSIRSYYSQHNNNNNNLDEIIKTQLNYTLSHIISLEKKELSNISTEYFNKKVLDNEDKLYLKLKYNITLNNFGVFEEKERRS